MASAKGHVATLAASVSGRATVGHIRAPAQKPLEQALRLFHPAALQRWLSGADSEPALTRLRGGDEASAGAPAAVVIRPAGPKHANPAGLQKLIGSALPELEAVARRSGAILFRGWQLQQLEDFDGALRSLRSRPTDFFGTAPRRRLKGSGYLFRNVAFEAPAAAPEDGTRPALTRARIRPDVARSAITKAVEQAIHTAVDRGRLGQLVALAAELERRPGGIDSELKRKLGVVWADTTVASKSHPQLFNCERA
eukprot:SAG11_NODE_9622_length_895_cov_1.363065_1_plen_253_part_00